MAQPPTLNEADGSYQYNAHIDETSGRESVTSIKLDPNSLLTNNLSFVNEEDVHGNRKVTNADGITIRTPNDYATFIEGNSFHSVFGDASENVANKFTYVQGNEMHHSGEQGPTKVAAAIKLQEATRKIDDKKIDTIKKTAGTKVECPNCANEVASDGGMCVIELACKIIRIGIPNFPYPLDIIQKFLNFLGIPLLTPEPIKKLNGGKGCGSPGCKSGTVETMQKPIETANKIGRAHV